MKIDIQYTKHVVQFLPFMFICNDEEIQMTYFAFGWLGLYIFIYND